MDAFENKKLQICGHCTQINQFFFQGENAEFTVHLEDLEGSKIAYKDAFFVAPNAGYKNEKFELAVRNAKPLDYENSDYVNFQFYVSFYLLFIEER